MVPCKKDLVSHIRLKRVVARPDLVLGNLRSYDGNCNENATLKLNFALSQVFCDYFMLIMLYKIGELHFRLLGTNGFHVKAKSKKFTAATLRCRQNLKYENFHVVV